MKIILVSVGTRGDVEPLLALGNQMQARGHQVIGAFPGQFRDITESSQIEFVSLGSKFIELLESDIGKAAMGGAGGLKRIISLLKLSKAYQKIDKEVINAQYELIEKDQPDRIIHNGKSIYPMIWAIKNPGKTIHVSPVPYVLHHDRKNTHVAFGSNYGPFLNRLTYRLANFGLILAIWWTARKLDISGVTYSKVKKSLLQGKSLYTISPTLMDRPEYWHSGVRVVGYQERNKRLNWKPNKDLLEFIKIHPKILLITFGSMSNPDPPEKTKIIIEILDKNEIPAIINIAAGGLIEPNEYNYDLILFVKNIPYDWIFPKIYGVIHHGGAGTTHLALKYGCASMIIPHIIDQFVWNKILARKGVGPMGIAVNKIRVQSLENKVVDLFTNKQYKRRAIDVANEMNKEDYSDEIRTLIED